MKLKSFTHPCQNATQFYSFEREREREGFVLYVGVTELLGILYGKRRRMQEMKEVSQGNMSHMREKAKKSQLKLSDK